MGQLKDAGKRLLTRVKESENVKAAGTLVVVVGGVLAAVAYALHDDDRSTSGDALVHGTRSSGYREAEADSDTGSCRPPASTPSRTKGTSPAPTSFASSNEDQRTAQPTRQYASSSQGIPGRTTTRRTFAEEVADERNAFIRNNEDLEFWLRQRNGGF